MKRELKDIHRLSMAKPHKSHKANPYEKGTERLFRNGL